MRTLGVRGDHLVVFADGISSTARRRIFPDLERQYAGYVGWRGTVPEHAVSASTRTLLSDALTYSVAPNTHIVLYPIPGPGGGAPGRASAPSNDARHRNVAAGRREPRKPPPTHGNSTSICRRPAGTSRSR